MPPSSRGFFRPREKSLIVLVLATFSFVVFCALFYLPAATHSGSDPLGVLGGGHNRVFKVYKDLQAAGHEFMLPPPPVDNAAGSAFDNPNVRHNVLDRPDPHKVDDRARLLAQIEMDEQIEELRLKHQQQQQVLPKPNLNLVDVAQVGSSSSSASSSSAKQQNVQNVAEGKKGAAREQDGGVIVQEGEDDDVDAKKKRDTVKKMMKHAWDGYAKYAWGKNEIKPVSRRGHSAGIFGTSSMGATIVDGMDTLYIMGLMEEYNAGRAWVESTLDFNQMNGDVSVFETNIRYVGGLLSLYALTGDDLYKEKAVHIVDKLLPAFNTPTGIPYALINIRSGSAKNFGWASGGSSILSEFGTLHMEFAYLSDITGDRKYLAKVERIREVLQSVTRPKTLYPNYLNPKTGKWGQEHTSVGALGDSFYEYLLKEWLRSGKKDLQAKHMFDDAAKNIVDQLVKVSPGGLTYIAEYKYGRLEHKMDHLACFAAGMFGLAAHEEQDRNSDRWMEVAAGITNTCHESYDRADTKLGPEAFRFSDAVEARAVKATERFYILRPETFESYFVMWRLTHDQKYRDWGWEAVQALEKHCKSEAGYSGLKNVYAVDGQKDDVQQSFFLAETLKYLYLLFSDDGLISLDQWVFNTEAHPLPIKGANSMYRPFAAGKSKKKAVASDGIVAESKQEDVAANVVDGAEAGAVAVDAA